MIADCLLKLAPEHLAANADRFDLCSSEPKSWDDVLSKSLGHRAGLKIAKPTKSAAGYKVKIGPVAEGGNLTGRGQATHWALSSAARSELLMSSPLAEPEAVKAGNKFEIPAFHVLFPNAASDAIVKSDED